MPDDDVERRLRDLERDHDLTRWYTGRVDRDLAQIAATQSEHTRLMGQQIALLQTHSTVLQSHTQKLEKHDERLDSIDAKLQEHDAHFESLHGQMRSLTQMMGEVLKRLPPAAENGESGD